jgi:hypothetical protein
MLIKVKVKRSDWKQELESFGNNMYLAYIISDSEEYTGELMAVISKKLGVPPGRIELKSRNGRDFVFDLR